MLTSVPQYIDVEDKIVGPLTAKQLFWLIGMAVLLLILWNILPKLIFFVVGLPIGLLFIAAAFYRPFGQPLPNFVFQGFLYLFRPKIYVWRRTAKQEKIITKTKPKNTPIDIAKDKHMSSETLHELAQVLDSEGRSHNKEIDEWILSHSSRKQKRNLL